MSSCPILTAALPLTEQPQTPSLGPIPSLFFYTNTCPSCLDLVAIGNQIAECELRKPHPVSQTLPRWRLVNCHSELGQFLKPAQQKRESDHWTASCSEPAQIQFVLAHRQTPHLHRVMIETFLGKDNCSRQLYHSRDLSRPENSSY